MSRQTILGVLVGVVFMALAFLGIPLSEFFAALWTLNLGWLGLFTLLLLAQVGLQALRQQIMLAEAAPQMTLQSSFSIMVIGQFSIQAFPARLGELARPWLLKRAESVPYGAGLGILALERALDLVALLLALVLMLLWVDTPSVELVVAGYPIDLAAWGWSSARQVVVVLCRSACCGSGGGVPDFASAVGARGRCACLVRRQVAVRAILPARARERARGSGRLIERALERWALERPTGREREADNS